MLVVLELECLQTLSVKIEIGSKYPMGIPAILKEGSLLRINQSIFIMSIFSVFGYFMGCQMLILLQLNK